MADPVTTSAATDADLIRRWVGYRDQAAFNAIDDRYRPLVLGLVHHKLGGDPVLRAGVEDVVQDVFVYLVHRAESQVASGVPLNTWLATVAVSRATDYFRRNRRHARPAGGEAEGGGPIETVAAPQPAGESDAHVALRACLNDMPDVTALVYPLYWEGKTGSAVAAELKVANATVSRRHDQARERLRACVERRLALGGRA